DIQQLDELELVVVMDNETDTLSSITPGIPQVAELTALAERTRPGQRGGHACTAVFDQLCYGCHGFSVLFRAKVGDRRHQLLFDVGPDGELWLENARRLGIERTVSDLSRLVQPRLVAPGHCTGWRAKAQLARAFAPGRHAPSVVGTRYRLV